MPFPGLGGGGHQVVVFDRSPQAVSVLASKGATATSSLEDLGQKLKGPRVFWMMIPAGAPVDVNANGRVDAHFPHVARTLACPVEVVNFRRRLDARA